MHKIDTLTVYKIHWIFVILIQKNFVYDFASRRERWTLDRLCQCIYICMHHFIIEYKKWMVDTFVNSSERPIADHRNRFIVFFNFYSRIYKNHHHQN